MNLKEKVDTFILPDLQPIRDELSALSVRVSEIPIIDLNPIIERLSTLETKVNNLVIPDITPLETQISDLQAKYFTLLNEKFPQLEQQIESFKVNSTKMIEFISLVYENPSIILPPFKDGSQDDASKNKNMWKNILEKGITY